MDRKLAHPNGEIYSSLINPKVPLEIGKSLKNTVKHFHFATVIIMDLFTLTVYHTLCFKSLLAHIRAVSCTGPDALLNNRFVATTRTHYNVLLLLDYGKIAIFTCCQKHSAEVKQPPKMLGKIQVKGRLRRTFRLNSSCGG